MRDKLLFGLIFLLITGIACNKDDETGDPDPCESDQVFDQSRGACDQTLSFTSVTNENLTNGQRILTANNIPEHKVGLFGMGPGSLNPNAISPQSNSYTLALNPQKSTTLTPLLSTSGTGPNAGPQYSFGILFNGVELDPVAAEPFPHSGIMSPNVNWEWNLEALNVNLGLDCNSAHVQPNGKYHYHGKPTLFLEGLSIPTNTMTLIGYAADGFPIYYKYAYSQPQNSQSNVTPMTSSYQLKEGDRPGDGVEAPCGTYDGVYSNDYEYIEGLGTLDEANGREGVTPEFPNGTYYYVITDEFPSIPRFFRGTPSVDFKIGA
ncbi:MAG: YHYH protein [Bacteroidota bacterium]